MITLVVAGLYELLDRCAQHARLIFGPSVARLPAFALPKTVWLACNTLGEMTCERVYRRGCTVDHVLRPDPAELCPVVDDMFPLPDKFVHLDGAVVVDQADSCEG